MPDKRAKKVAGKKRVRPTIGLLIGEDTDSVSWTVWQGVNDVARERDANLICFVGGSLHTPVAFETNANVLYDLVGPENVDGLVIWSGGIGQYASLEEMEAFCKQYQPLPIVSVALPFEGVHSLVAGNYDGMRDVITHLIEVHGCRRIAFIRGPEGHPEAEDRYRAYVDVLAAYGISLDPKIVLRGNFESAASAQAVSKLLDQRGGDFDAVAAADDSMAWAAMSVLKARGLRVPEDVAVVGFDDEEASRYKVPPLTTVSSGVYEQGRQSAEMLLALLAGEEVPEKISLPARPVLRQSCGCVSSEVARAALTFASGAFKAFKKRAKGETFEVAFAAQREDILSEMTQRVGPIEGLEPEWAAQLVDAFVAGIEEKSAGGFIDLLGDILDHVIVAGADTLPWQSALSTLRCHVLPYLSGDEALWAEDLWQQARVMIWEAEQQVQVRRRVEAEETWTALLQIVGLSLATMTNMTDFIHGIEAQLPALVPSFYLSLYRDPYAPVNWSELLVAYDEKGRIELQADKQRFPSAQLLPPGLPRYNRRYTLIAKDIYFQDRQLGLALLEVGPRDGMFYQALGIQLGSTLHKVLLIEQMEKRELWLQTATEVSRAISGVLDPDQVLQQVVDLVRERFGLYYTGLFLIDAPGKWAVLRAGTGEAGQKMLEEGHRLEVGGHSMIGQCAATKEACIAMDVSEEVVRFKNPHLPDTRSEMALPLLGRGEIIGALTIQSTNEDAFSVEDIVVLQVMADQMANAIMNARLHERTQGALREMEAVQRRYLEQAWTEYLGARMVKGYEHDGATLIPLGDELPPGAQQALRERRPVIWRDESDGGPAILVVPVMVRGRPLGVLGLKAGQEQEWGDEDIALAEALGEQFGQAAEAVRLLDETQRRVAQERVIREMSDRIQRASEMESLMRTTAEELNRVLRSSRVYVRLGTEEDLGKEVSDE
ncbi:MAG: substrate-binding domain-containing protein [Anaerolineae bacterium]|nr:substrate-binding domain-containing protein [Anaerolineae bacterium]